MQKIYVYLVLFFALPIMAMNAQNKQSHSNEIIFWFKVKVFLLIDKQENRPVYKIQQIYPKIESGNSGQFSEVYKKNLENQALTIGPFSDKKSAALSIDLYTMISKDSKYSIEEKISKITPAINEFYWFYTKFNFLEKNKNIQFNRIAACVSRGSISEFAQNCLEGLSMEQFLMGPFTNQKEAEIAKYYERLLGEESSDKLRNNKKYLDKMADEFSLLKPSGFTIKYDDHSKDSIFSISIQIPPKYFNEYSMLVLSPQLVNENGTIINLHGYTVQGEKVEDNNPIISFDKGGTINYSESYGQNGKINKLIIKGTFLNQLNLIEAKDIELKL